MQNIKNLKGVLLACALSAVSFASVAQENQQEQQNQPQFVENRWTISCDMLVDSQDFVCEQSKSVINASVGARLLAFSVRNLVGQEGHEVFVVLPHGVNIQNGVSIKVDEGDAIQFPILRSNADGLLAGKILDEELNQQFLKGSNAVVTFAMSNGQNVNVSFSLGGYTAAFTKLNAK